MKLTTVSIIEHKSAGNQRLSSQTGVGILVPGASSCCVGCSSTSCAAIVSPK
jgi:hypothetical protein